MSKPESDTSPQPSPETASPKRPERRPDSVGVETRIDTAHVVEEEQEQINSEAASSDEQQDSAAIEPAGDAGILASQLRAQADQLAAHLRTRQRDLDQREMQLNARAAQLDNDTRSARLWLAEHQAECNERNETLLKKEREVQSRLGRLASAETALQGQCAELDAQQQTHAQALHQRQVELDARAEGIAAREEEIQRLLHREQRLQEEETQLAALREQTESLHIQVVDERQRLEEKTHAERERLVEERRAMVRELQEQRETLRRRSEHNEQSRASLEQLRAELARMHRVTLEIRLATEELWVELSGAAPPARITQSLGRIRSKLAEDYRLANAELSEKRAELQSVRQQLRKQCQTHSKRKRQLDQWVAGCRKELEKQAAWLVAREQELDHQENQFRNQARQWQAERMEYEAEIRRLRASMPQSDLAPASA